MTGLGLFLSRKSVNQSDVTIKTGVNKKRLSELANNEGTKCRVDELCLIAMVIEVNPCDVLKEICKELELKD